MSNNKPNLGATGKFPKGKLNEHDEGKLAFSIYAENKNVVIDFGKSVAWFAFEPTDAVKIAEQLIRMARIAAKKSNDIITVKL